MAILQQRKDAVDPITLQLPEVLFAFSNLRYLQWCMARSHLGGAFGRTQPLSEQR